LTSKVSSPKPLVVALALEDSKVAVAALVEVSAAEIEVAAASAVVSVVVIGEAVAASVAVTEAVVADSEGKSNFKEKIMMNCFNE
jgi:hypothetical protein